MQNLKRLSGWLLALAVTAVFALQCSRSDIKNSAETAMQADENYHKSAAKNTARDFAALASSGPLKIKEPGQQLSRKNSFLSMAKDTTLQKDSENKNSPSAMITEPQPPESLPRQAKILDRNYHK